MYIGCFIFIGSNNFFYVVQLFIFLSKWRFLSSWPSWVISMDLMAEKPWRWVSNLNQSTCQYELVSSPYRSLCLFTSPYQTKGHLQLSGSSFLSVGVLTWLVWWSWIGHFHSRTQSPRFFPTTRGLWVQEWVLFVHSLRFKMAAT